MGSEAPGAGQDPHAEKDEDELIVGRKREAFEHLPDDNHGRRGGESQDRPAATHQLIATLGAGNAVHDNGEGDVDHDLGQCSDGPNGEDDGDSQVPRDQQGDQPGEGISHDEEEAGAAEPGHNLPLALEEAAEMINSAAKPVILAGVEVHRFGLQDALLKLSQKNNIPVAATILGKSVIGEQHPSYMGVYGGAMGRDDVRRYVESSDCVIMLGVFMTDVNLGIYTAHLDPARSIYATSEKLSIRYHSFENVRFKDFMRGLLNTRLQRRAPVRIPRPQPLAPFLAAHRKDKVTVKSLFQRLNAFLTENTVVVADVGDALFGAADLSIHHRTEFLGPAYYASMGFAVPAGNGAKLANPKMRPLVLVGDGAFQMTGSEIAHAPQYGCNPIVVVFNNTRWEMLQAFFPEARYNETVGWPFAQLAELWGGRGFCVATPRELHDALKAAYHDTGFTLIEIGLKQGDMSPILRGFVDAFKKRVYKEAGAHR